MKLQQNHEINRLYPALIILTLFCVILQPVLMVYAQSGLIIKISSDSTRAKASSPHHLTGPVLVSQGVILSIEEGVIVNLNGYELRVNGTLIAEGTLNEQIRFVNGTINFTEFSAAWDSQTGSGSILQFVVFDNVNLIESVPVNINNNFPIQNGVIWTKENSPYDLVGNLIVDSGATLTIEPGTIVNLNGYLLRIDGCLVAVGTNDEPINFTGGSITLGEQSMGWDEQSGSGSRVENAVLSDVSLTSHVSLFLTDCIVDAGRVYGNSLTILNCNIGTRSEVSGKSVIKDSTLGELFLDGGSIIIANNVIDNMDCSGGSPLITNNKIFGLGGLELTRDNTTINFFVADSPVISNNEITGGIYLECNSATVTDNTIYPRKYTVSWSWWERLYLYYTDSRSEITTGVFINGYADVFRNTIIGSSVGIEGLETVQGNTFHECEIGVQGATTIKENLFVNNSIGIKPNVQALIQSNMFENNSIAIDTRDCPSATIEDNMFIDNDNGILASGDVVVQRNTMDDNSIAMQLASNVSAEIQNNSFTKNDQAITINGNPSSIVLYYNNFEGNRNNTICLKSVTKSIDATNNWWGTTDSETINLAIFDSKYSFDLGTVNITPFLTEPNPHAMPNENPEIVEFLSWVLLPLFLVAALLVVFVRKKVIIGGCTK